MKETKTIPATYFSSHYDAKRVALLGRLRELAASIDPEMAHVEADKLLLEYINDKEIRDAFEAVPMWYA